MSKGTPPGLDKKTAAELVQASEAQSAAVAKAEAFYGKVFGSKDGKRKPATPWLLIRTFPTDAGLRPLPSTQQVWESPDISVQSPDPSGNPVAGQKNYLYARVFNLGALRAAPVRVDFYWGNPSVGLDAAHMHIVGTEYVQIPPLQSLVVRCNHPWVPTYENGGHECIIVNCTNWVADPITYPFQPLLDRHVGQRNMSVIPAAAGTIVRTTIHLNNVLAEKVGAEVMATSIFARVDPKTIQKFSDAQLISQILAFSNGEQADPGIGTVDRSHEHPVLTAKLSESRSHFKIQARERPERAPLEATRPRLKEAGAAPGVFARLLQTTLDLGEGRSFELQISVPAGAQTGQFIVVRLAQVVNTDTVGGYTVIVKVTG